MISPLSQVVQFFSSSPDGQSSVPSHTCVHYKYRKQNRLKIWLSWKFQIWNNLEWKQFVSQQWHEECTWKYCYFQLNVVSKKCSAKSIIQTFLIEMISPLSQVVQFFSSSPDGQSLVPSHTCVHYKYRKQNRLKIGLSWKFQIWNNLEWKQFVSQQWHEECTLKCCYFQLKVVFKKCSAKIIIQTWTTGIHFP